MYETHFLKDDGRLSAETKAHIETVVGEGYGKVHTTLNLIDCNIFFIISEKRILPGECFQESPCDHDSLYMFIDCGIEKRLEDNQQYVTDNLIDHLFGGLYATARAKNIGLTAECGLIEEIISEGFSGHFIAEQNGGQVKPYYTNLQKNEIASLWRHVIDEGAVNNTDIEKWYWGSDKEKIPPLAALSLGYAAVNSYLRQIKRDSGVGLTTPAGRVVATIR